MMKQFLVLFCLFTQTSWVLAQSTNIPTPILWAGTRVFPDAAAKNLLEQRLQKILSDSSNCVILQKRSKLYFPYLEKILVSQKIHPDFKFLALRESGLQPLYSKDKNAAGFWQISKEDAENAALEVNPAIDERKHIFIATHYFAQVLQKQHSELSNPLAVLAVKELGFEEAKRQFGNLEGQQNISLTVQSPAIWFDILAQSLVFRNLDTVSLAQTLVPFRFTKGKKLSEIAEMAGVEPLSLQIYNPWIQDKNRALGKDYAVFIPIPRNELASMKARMGVNDETEIFVREGLVLKEWEKMAFLLNPSNEVPILYDPNRKNENKPAPQTDNPQKDLPETIIKPLNTGTAADSVYIEYMVRPKDSFKNIAQKYNTTIPEIWAWNGMDNQSKIIVGKMIKIKIKDFAAELLGITKIKPDPKPEVQPVLEIPTDQQQTYTLIYDETIGQIAGRLFLKPEMLASWNGIGDLTTPLKKGVKLQLKKKIETYQGEFGESIDQIAQKMSLDPEKLAVWNQKVSHYAIYSETETIFLFDKTIETTQTPPKSSQGSVYTTVSGDNIYTVAQKLGVSVSDLRTWNNIPAGTDELKEGTKITIK